MVRPPLSHYEHARGERLGTLLRERFEVVTFTDGHRPHSVGRSGNVRVLARKIPDTNRVLDKEKILKAYEARLP